MKQDYIKLQELKECIFNDNIYCDRTCAEDCFYYPKRNSNTLELKPKQITIEDILNGKEAND